ncbi:Ribosomal protein S16 [Spironucleus salmonicida]|uniref:Ribosomal protein S16 n=1 Tax=Spironucleus salmonicida TaxID=348837 RepID=V6LGZ4_9EUKA|nr:Ribosomal protein S16 [Spironucleus salmonicida]|eukprot:EST43820.1 Ribosomal protein S16 [Spironucleus salmonicida]
MSTTIIAKKKTAVARAIISNGKGEIRVNNVPLSLIRPEILREKAMEAVALVGEKNLSHININITVRGGGYVSQLYAVRQAIAKSIVASITDAEQKENIKKLYLSVDRQMLVADTRVCEAKKFGGRGARARRQKSYR